MQLSRSTADRLDEFSYFVAHYREVFTGMQMVMALATYRSVFVSVIGNRAIDFNTT